MQTAIPINMVLTAAKDVELKKLLRAKATASARVARAIEAEADAEGAIHDYIAATYPTAPSPRKSAPDYETWNNEQERLENERVDALEEERAGQ